MANVYTRKHKYALSVSHQDYKDPTMDHCIRPIHAIAIPELYEREIFPRQNEVSEDIKEADLLAKLQKIQKTNWTCGECGMGKRGVVPTIHYDPCTTQRCAFTDPNLTPELIERGGKTRSANIPVANVAEGIVPNMTGKPYVAVPACSQETS